MTRRRSIRRGFRRIPEPVGVITIVWQQQSDQKFGGHPVHVHHSMQLYVHAICGASRQFRPLRLTNMML